MHLLIEGSGPSGSHLRASLDAGEALLVERHALLSVHGAYRHEVFSGTKSAKRWLLKLYGQDLLHNLYRSEGQGTVFRFIPQGGYSLGVLHYQPAEPLFLHPAAHFAHPPAMQLSAVGLSLKTVINGSPLLSVGGPAGHLVFKAAGDILTHRLERETPLRVDEDAIVALSGDVRLEPIAKSGMKETLTSGEGFLSELSGEGTVYLQSRKAADFSRKGGSGWWSGWLAS